MTPKKHRRPADKPRADGGAGKAYRIELDKAIHETLETCRGDTVMCHLGSSSIPSREAVVGILQGLEEVLFPGYFGRQELDDDYLRYHMGNQLNILLERLSRQISKAYVYQCKLKEEGCDDCADVSQKQALRFIRQLPKIRTLIAGDVKAAYRNDPAAQSFDEVVISYPAIKAITYYRLAHELSVIGVPLIPRIMTEHGHTLTGIDIHPGAKIGRNFFIDHGTGVVIGETTEIGDNVVLYQGVTLGALHFVKDENGRLIRGTKRHPTVEDNVTIYANATILGGNTVIGSNSIIGGNVWLTESVPANCKIVTEYRALNITGSKPKDRRSLS